MQTAISIFGRDRPGIIASLTKSLASKGANIEDASMTLLQGYFAMILVATFEDVSLDEIEEFLKSNADLDGFSISMAGVLKPESESEKFHKAARYVFHLSVADTPGIVSSVTQVLGVHGANVVDCATRKNNDTGVFTMILDVDVPVEEEEKIVQQLTMLASDFSGDVVFQRVDDVDL